MAPSVHLLLLLTISLSLVETPESAPAHWGRGGWTLNSAGYLLGPVLHPSPKADQGRQRDSALEILELWKVIGGLPYSQPAGASKRTPTKATCQGTVYPREAGSFLINEVNLSQASCHQKTLHGQINNSCTNFRHIGPSYSVHCPL